MRKEYREMEYNITPPRIGAIRYMLYCYAEMLHGRLRNWRGVMRGIERSKIKELGDDESR
jgi:hypothetical protein